MSPLVEKSSVVEVEPTGIGSSPTARVEPLPETSNSFASMLRLLTIFGSRAPSSSETKKLLVLPVCASGMFWPPTANLSPGVFQSPSYAVTLACGVPEVR